MIDQLQDVSIWNRTAFGDKLPKAKSEACNESDDEKKIKLACYLRDWQQSQLPHYLSEWQEYEEAKTDSEIADALFDTKWTLFNFFIDQEHLRIKKDAKDKESVVFLDQEKKLNEALNNPMPYSNARLPDRITEACRFRRVFNILQLAAEHLKEVNQLIADKGIDDDKLWEIGSKSNWAKFAKNEKDAAASLDYYAYEKGVKCTFEKVGKVYVLTVDGDQFVNGKEYPHGKIMKCGKFSRGKFIPWAEPDWNEALPK